jgi:hypothetical protein
MATESLSDPVPLAEHAAEIRRLGKRVVADIIEIGRRLTKCKRICGHGNFLPWLDREFGWSEDTAERFIQVAALSNQIPQVAEFILPISGLYLLAAPSTPDEARTEIVERAEAGEPVSVAKIKRVIDTVKAAKVPGFPAIYRATKLGPEIMAKIEGTSLDNAREKDELIRLNRGAPEGGHTPEVKRLVAAAKAGKAVSAVAYTKSGAAFRREDIGPDSRGECERLRVCNEELKNKNACLRRENKALRDRVAELRAQLDDIPGFLDRTKEAAS